MSEMESTTAVDVESKQLDVPIAAPPADSAAAPEVVGDATAEEAAQVEASSAGDETSFPDIESPGDNGMLDDVEAELALLEQMSREDAESIPDLDDGTESEDQPKPTAASSSKNPDDETADGLGDDDLAAALAEVEQLAARPKKRADEDKAGEQADSSGDSKPRTKPTRFKIGKKTSEEKNADAEATKAQTAPKTIWGRCACDWIQKGLDAVNRPFEGLSDRTRGWIGFISLVTIATSILTMYLMPIIHPNRDAIVFLQERRAALDNPPPAEETEAEAEK